MQMVRLSVKGKRGRDALGRYRNIDSSVFVRISRMGISTSFGVYDIGGYVLLRAP